MCSEFSWPKQCLKVKFTRVLLNSWATPSTGSLHSLSGEKVLAGHSRDAVLGTMACSMDESGDNKEVTSAVDVVASMSLSADAHAKSIILITRKVYHLFNLGRVFF